MCVLVARQPEARDPLSEAQGRGWGSWPLLPPLFPRLGIATLLIADPLHLPVLPRDIQDRSIIKIYRKEPLYAAFPGSHLTNGDLRVWLRMPRALGRLGKWDSRARTLVTCHQGPGPLLEKGTEAEAEGGLH